ncbi:Uncharacterised protein [Bordetella pertussis]|nr:Uncharacterised protein [Bordetella pertussis]CFP57239.1 Uncharacterised protein [Bordetella pertussis]CFU04326.1 Uncharacterised protein [Bordetella pertussis]CFW39819.1 Uncharacterised protein [Bordetella pertussis]
MPPAPGRFSTTTGWPHILLRLLATRRVKKSELPPGGNDTIIVTGLVGYAAPLATAGPASMPAAAHTAQVASRRD